MNRDELLDKIEAIEYWQEHYANKTFLKALHAVITLHLQVNDNSCKHCVTWYPCETIKAIQKELN